MAPQPDDGGGARPGRISLSFTPPLAGELSERVRRDSGGLASESLTGLTAEAEADEDRRRRVTYLMAFRVGLMTLVLGATSVLYWLSNVDLASPGALILFVIIAATFLATIVYAVLLRRGVRTIPLAYGQLIGDLVVASVLIHTTGGAQSAYTFFLPLTIIGATTVLPREGALRIAIAAAALFAALALLGWFGVLPALAGQRVLPTDLTAIEMSRALGLNLVAISGVSLLALNLSGQLQAASVTLASHQSAAADLLSLHADIVRSLSSGLLTVDGRGAISTINEVACDMLGTTVDRMIGAPLDALLPGLTVRVKTLGASGSLHRTELTVPSGGGRELTLGISVSPLKSASGQLLGQVVNFQDLTDLRQMEHHVKRAERLAVVGGMAAGVAHEIRNPLASISGSIELLRSMPQDDDDSRALMEIVTREIDRLNGLLTELLDYTNPRPPKMSPFKLADLVRDTLQVFGQDRVLGKVEVAFTDRTSDGGEIAADAAKLRQVLWNLLRNAAEAAGRGGGHVAIDLVQTATGIELAVSDDGPGIAPEDREQIFDPFFTTKAKGHGLGLAIVQSIVTEHGGTVRVEPIAGPGARLTVRLPTDRN